VVPLDNATKSAVQSIPLLSVRAGPRDGDQWIARLKQELNSLIAYVNNNKKADNDWFIIEPNRLGTKSVATLSHTAAAASARIGHCSDRLARWGWLTGGMRQWNQPAWLCSSLCRSS
jgi:hypothetical protein